MNRNRSRQSVPNPPKSTALKKYCVPHKPTRAPLRLRARSLLAGGLLVSLLCAVALYLHIDPIAKDGIGTEEDVGSLLGSQPSAAFCSMARPPYVCAHGGDTSNHPPNTLAAYAAAISAGADCIELDVSLTSDSQLVNMHDRDLQLLVGSTDAKVRDHSLAQLQSSVFAWPSGDAVLTVAHALAATAPYVQRVILDVKTSAADKVIQLPDGRAVSEHAHLMDSLLQLVAGQPCSHCLIWAKSDGFMKQVKARAPSQLCGYVVMYGRSPADAHYEQPLRPGMQKVEVAAVYHGMLDKSLMATLHSGNKSVHVWSVDEPAELQRMLDLGVHGVVTNRPALLIEAISNRLAKCG